MGINTRHQHQILKRNFSSPFQSLIAQIYSSYTLNMNAPTKIYCIYKMHYVQPKNTNYSHWTGLQCEKTWPTDDLQEKLSISSARNNKNCIFKHFLSGFKSSHQPKSRGQTLPCNVKCQCHLVLPINISCVSALATGCGTEPSQSIYSLMPNAVLVSKSKSILLDLLFKYFKLPGVIIWAWTQNVSEGMPCQTPDHSFMGHFHSTNLLLNPDALKTKKLNTVEYLLQLQ